MDEMELEEFIRNHVKPTKCTVISLEKSKSEKRNTFHAVVDLGTFEKVQQAIRELSGRVMEDGNCLAVSVDFDPAELTPGRDVYLYGIPEKGSARDLYDLLSKFGTIVRLSCKYQNTSLRQLRVACVTFSSDEEAQGAMQFVNQNSLLQKSIIAQSGKNFRNNRGETLRFQDKESDASIGLPRSLELKKTGSAVIMNKTAELEEYKGGEVEVSTSVGASTSMEPPRKRSVLHPNQDAEFGFGFALIDRGHSQVGKKSREYDVQELSHGLIHLNVTEAQDTTKEVPSEIDLFPAPNEVERKKIVCDLLLKQYGHEIQPQTRLEKILRVLRASLDTEQLFELCIKRGRLHAYVGVAEAELAQSNWIIQPLPTATLDAIEVLDLAKKPTTEDKLQAIQERLYQTNETRYPGGTLERILDTIVTELDMRTLLDLCANEKEFHLIVFHAQVASQEQRRITKCDLPKAVKELIWKLELDKLNSPRSWKKMLRKHLLNVYRVRYGGEQLRKVLEKLFESPLLPAEIYELLKEVVELSNDEDRFRITMFHANMAIKRCAQIVQFHLPFGVKQLILQHDLDQCDTIFVLTEAWNETLRWHLVLMYRIHYGMKRLEEIMQILLDALKSTSDLYCLLENSTIVYRFCLYVVAADISVATKRPFLYETIPNAMVALVREMKLHNLAGLEATKQSLRANLIRLYRKRFSTERLKAILDAMFRDVQSLQGLYGLLEMCSNPDRCNLYAALADVALGKGETRLVFRPISEAAMKLVYELQLEKLTSIDAWRTTLFAYLIECHSGSFGRETMERIVEKMALQSVSPLDLLNLLDCCAEEHRFCLYMAAAQSAMEKNRRFRFCYIPESIVEEVQQMNLDAPGCVKVIKNALLRHWTGRKVRIEDGKSVDADASTIEVSKRVCQFVGKCLRDECSTCDKVEEKDDL